MFTKRTIQTLVMALLMTVAWTGAASATFFLTASDIDANDPFDAPAVPGDGPPLGQINLINGTGRTYTNTYTFSGDADGVGNRVRTIVAGFLSSTEDGVSLTDSPIGGPGDQTNQIISVAVLDGIVTAPNVVSYDAGRIGLWTDIDVPSTFNVDSPDTWNFFGTAAAPGTFSEWELANATNVDGSDPLSAGLSSSAAVVNTASANLLEDDLESQGRFLFVEDSQNAVVPIPDPNPANTGLPSGDTFVEVLDNQIEGENFTNGLFSPGDVTGEGIFITNEDNIRLFTTDQIGDGLDAADLATLNAIGIWGTTDLDDLDVDNDDGLSVDGLVNGTAGFATGFTGNAAGPGDAAFLVPDSDFNPRFLGQGSGQIFSNGDFIAQNDPDIHPGVFTGVPEPTTAVLGLMGLAGIGFRRRRNA